MENYLVSVCKISNLPLTKSARKHHAPVSKSSHWRTAARMVYHFFGNGVRLLDPGNRTWQSRLKTLSPKPNPSADWFHVLPFISCFSYCGSQRCFAKRRLYANQDPAYPFPPYPQTNANPIFPSRCRQIRYGACQSLLVVRRGGNPEGLSVYDPILLALQISFSSGIDVS